MAGRKVRATFTIDAELKERLDRTIPASKRSEYLQASLERSLSQTAREDALQTLRALPRLKPSDGRETVEVLREIRTAHTTRLVSRDD